MSADNRKIANAEWFEIERAREAAERAASEARRYVTTRPYVAPHGPDRPPTVVDGPEPFWLHRPHGHPDDTPGPPGHSADRGRMHLENLCAECTAVALARTPLGEVEEMYRVGRVGGTTFDAYRYVWASSAYRYGHQADLWRREPTEPVAVRMVEWLRWAMGRRT